MKEIQVQIVETELAQASIERVQGRVVAVVTDLQLGRHEQLRAPVAAARDAFTDLALVVVGRHRVDETVAARNGRRHGNDRRSGGDWNTPKPSAGIVTPLLSVVLFMEASFQCLEDVGELSALARPGRARFGRLRPSRARG